MLTLTVSIIMMKNQRGGMKSSRSRAYKNLSFLWPYMLCSSGMLTKEDLEGLNLDWLGEVLMSLVRIRFRYFWFS